MEIKAPWLKFYDGIRQKLNYPDMTISDAVFDVAKQYPDKTALVYMDRKISYKELVERVLCVQKGLEDLGIKKNDRIMVCLPNIPQAVFLLYAADRIGAVCSFVHPLSAKNELSDYVTQLDAKCVAALDFMYDVFAVMSDSVGERILLLTNMADELPLYKRILQKSSDKKKLPVKTKALLWSECMKRRVSAEITQSKGNAEKTAVVLFSGGTTGTPKGVMLSGKSINAMGMQTAQMCGGTILGKSMLSAMPIFHGFGLCVCVHTVLMCGGVCILVPRFSAKEYAKLIKKHHPNFIAGVPTLFEALLKESAMNKVNLSCLLGVFSGGDKLPETLKKKFDNFLKEHGSKVKLREGYGATECVTASCLMPPNSEKIGSVGIPFPDTYYKICAVGTTDEVPCNNAGEICIFGPTLMQGYLNSPKDTERALKRHKDGHIWLHTGDAGYMDEDGFVYFSHRLKRMIVTSGYNVYPECIESLLDKHPKINRSCVVGVQDDYKMQRVTAYVVPEEKTDVNVELKEELIQYCKESLALYSVPTDIIFLKSFPLTGAGKVAYAALERSDVQELLFES